MKRFIPGILLSAVLFFSCSTELTVQAGGTSGADISVTSHTKSEALAELLGSLGSGDVSANETGKSSAAPLFSAADIKAFLTGAGFSSVKATVSQDQISAQGSCHDVKAAAFANQGIISRTQNSLTLTIGSSQWKQLYENASEEMKGYLDLCMIPALTDETMTPSEYRSLLASVYGPSIASEIVDSPIVIYLAPPAGTKGGKKIKISTTLGALLSRTEEKSWSVNWQA